MPDPLSYIPFKQPFSDKIAKGLFFLSDKAIAVLTGLPPTTA